MAQIKTKIEIIKVEKACEITDDIFTDILKLLKQPHRQGLWGMTEIELRDLILSEIKERGLRSSFPPIVTSGIRAGNEIHPKPTDKKLEGFVIIDFGVVYEKYMSDMTRTIYVSNSKNRPNKKEKEIYNLVLKVQKLGIKKSKNGEKCANVDKVVRDGLGKYKKYFIHTLGHGVGTKIHENPKLYFKHTKPIIKENMIITIEPGIYIKNKLGIRIEDTCLITPKTCTPLTKSTKSLIIIKNKKL